MRPAVIALFSLLAISATAAHAQQLDDHSEAVHVSRQDLNRPATAQKLLARLQTASLDVCGAMAGSAPQVVEATRQSACYSDALRSAVAAARSPLVTEAYQASSGDRRARAGVVLAAR